jgi:predicted TIM-barrel fold metal-dependent hydrolase
VAHDALAANRLFVACQTNDDLPYLLETAGLGNLIIGTDYGHADLGSDIEAHRLIVERQDIPHEAARRIVDDNARLLFGLPAAS